MNYTHFFEEKLQYLKAESRYRIFTQLERVVGQEPYALWHTGDTKQKIIVWCSNDYLGMSHHPQVVDAFSKGAATYGVGAGGTRNISGTCHQHVLLEQTVACLHNKEAGLVFTSGYTANEATLCALGEHLPHCVFFSDEKNHASMIQGIRHSHAEKYVFSHNNMGDLKKKLQDTPKDRPKIIACVSVYSMDGDIAPLADICDLAHQHNALIFLDEVHAVGIYGPGGSGVATQMGLQDSIHIIQGNFAKAYGVVGGYIAGQSALVDFVRSYASGFIFTTSLPPATAMAARTSIEVLQESDDLRERLWQNVAYMKRCLEKTNIYFESKGSHILPIIVGDAEKCRILSRRLLDEYGHYLQPINYPTVPKGKERLRLTVTPQHTEEMMESLAQALNALWPQLSLTSWAA